MFYFSLCFKGSKCEENNSFRCYEKITTTKEYDGIYTSPQTGQSLLYIYIKYYTRGSRPDTGKHTDSPQTGQPLLYIYIKYYTRGSRPDTGKYNLNATSI